MPVVVVAVAVAVVVVAVAVVAVVVIAVAGVSAVSGVAAAVVVADDGMPDSRRGCGIVCRRCSSCGVGSQNTSGQISVDGVAHVHVNST